MGRQSFNPAEGRRLRLGWRKLTKYRYCIALLTYRPVHLVFGIPQDVLVNV